MFNILKGKIFGKNNKEHIRSLHNIHLKKSLRDNIAIFKEIFMNDGTILFRNFETKAPDSIKCCLIFADGMVEKEIINENVLLPIMRHSIPDHIDGSEILDFLINRIVVSGEVKKTVNVDELVGSIVYGDTIVLLDGVKEALIIDTKGWEFRTVSEPLSESVVRGPREGFTESIRVNLSLIRRKIRNSSLKFQFRVLGSRTKTRICLCYLEGVANQKILAELEERLDKIDIDGILETGYIEELIKDAPLSPFRTMGNTERPDVVAGKLLEGRIAVMCDGTPFVLTLPYVFIEHFQASEDYYTNYMYASLNRFFRSAGFFLSTSVPAIYTALVTFHKEMIPTPLLLSITAAREGVPFPTVVEALLMLFVFEIIREAGVRLPSAIGQTVSIVGALVLGEAAVAAKFVSAPMVIVAALTGIAAFLVPKMFGPLVSIRIVFLLLSAFLGLYGYIFGVIGLFIHLMSIRSFGIPYMLNVGSLNKQDLKDTAIRAPWWYMYYRPKLIGDRNPVRKDDAER